MLRYPTGVKRWCAEKRQCPKVLIFGALALVSRVVYCCFYTMPKPSMTLLVLAEFDGKTATTLHLNGEACATFDDTLFGAVVGAREVAVHSVEE